MRNMEMMKMNNKQKALNYLKSIKEEYDTYYMSNKVKPGDTHRKEFDFLLSFLEKDDKAKRGLYWIMLQYDCYYQNEECFNEENDENCFYYIEQQIRKSGEDEQN